MKTLKYSLTCLIACGMIFTGCKKKIEGELGTPTDKVRGLDGSWELIEFIQVDLNNPVKEERDLTEFYLQEGVEPFTINFTAEDQSYDVDIETGRNYFGESGTWSYDDNTYPSFIYLDSGMESIEMQLGSMVDQYDNTLNIELKRDCIEGEDITETVIYRFTFTRK
jgi:hypothetical protein